MMRCWSFDYKQWGKNPHGGKPIAEIKTETWSSDIERIKTDEEFFAARTKFLAEDAYSESDLAYPRVLVPHTSFYREYRKLDDPLPDMPLSPTMHQLEGIDRLTIRSESGAPVFNMGGPMPLDLND